MYHPINEDLARLAHSMNSMRDYRPDQTTSEYQAAVDRAFDIAEREKQSRPEYADAIDAIVARYSRKLAEWYNESSRIEAMCPSIMISGGSNFPVRKKERQNARRKSHSEKYQQIEGLLRKMQGVGTGGIKAGDANAIEKLEDKLESLEAAQETMKAANTYFRKHKTLDGCPDIETEQIEKIKASMSSSWRQSPVPFETWALSNNNANIHRVKDRIAELSKYKEQETTGHETDVPGVKVIEDTDLMRIQLVFDGKPEPEVRDILKRNGFRWAPSQSAWQRQLNANGRYAAKIVIQKLLEREIS